MNYAQMMKRFSELRDNAELAAEQGLIDSLKVCVARAMRVLDDADRDDVIERDSYNHLKNNLALCVLDKLNGKTPAR